MGCIFAVGLLLPTFASGSETSTISLVDYVELALKFSDVAHNLNDLAQLSDLETEAAGYRYATKVVPLANISAGNEVDSQALGLEAIKTTEFGTTVSVGGNTQKTNSDTFVVTNPYQSRVYVRVSQGLFRSWGKKYNRHSLTIAELNARRTAVSMDRKQQEIIRDAVNRYYTALLSRLLVDKSRQALERSAGHNDAAKARQQVGLVSKVDVYRAELARLSAENGYKDQMRQHTGNIERLYELLAMDVDDAYSLDTNIEAMTPVIPESWDENLLDYNQDWQAHIIELEISKRNLYIAERNTLPDVSLNFLVESEGSGDDVRRSTQLDSTNWSVQLQLRSTLQLFEEKSALTRARISRGQLKRTGQATKRRIYRAARLAMEDLEAEHRRHRISQEQVNQATMALDLSAIRYRQGLATNLGLLDAEAAYSDAEIGILRSQVAYNLACVQLGYALGILDMKWLQVSLLPVSNTTSTPNSQREQMR